MRLDLSAPPTLVNQLFNPQEIMCMYAAQTPQAARAPLRPLRDTSKLKNLSRQAYKYENASTVGLHHKRFHLFNVF